MFHVRLHHGVVTALATLLVCLSSWVNASETCDDCYVSDKGAFKYVLYNELPASVIPAIHQTLSNNTPRLLADFKLAAMPSTTVRVWKSGGDYLAAQKDALGVQFPGSTGYVFKNELRLLYTEGQTAQTALHEFVHLVTLKVNPAFANNPRWLWEAIAIYESEPVWYYANRLHLIRDRFDYLVNDLNANFNQSAAIYELGYTIGEYIDKKWGEEALLTLIKNNGDITKVTNMPMDALLKDWHAYVHATYFDAPKSQYEMILEKQTTR
ncbi:hypothetical protein L4C36_21350 [Photobacterium japonica]|uniref:hypothetical protein n=1 Tax=Photobacterium japonica TaxID=2910235 RepID=UPI003D0E1FC3